MIFVIYRNIQHFLIRGYVRDRKRVRERQTDRKRKRERKSEREQAMHVFFVFSSKCISVKHW